MSIIKKRIHLLDVNKSSLSSAEVGIYKREITKLKNTSVCPDLSTIEVATQGANAMQADGFCLTEVQIDV